MVLQLIQIPWVKTVLTEEPLVLHLIVNICIFMMYQLELLIVIIILLYNPIILLTWLMVFAPSVLIQFILVFSISAKVQQQLMEKYITVLTMVHGYKQGKVYTIISINGNMRTLQVRLLVMSAISVLVSDGKIIME